LNSLDRPVPFGPNQIAPCKSAFSPSEADVAQARKIIAASELPENHGKGVVAASWPTDAD
jgi:citrate lyase beta subunit